MNECMDFFVPMLEYWTRFLPSYFMFTLVFVVHVELAS